MSIRALALCTLFMAMAMTTFLAWRETQVSEVETAVVRLDVPQLQLWKSAL